MNMNVEPNMDWSNFTDAENITVETIRVTLSVLNGDHLIKEEVLSSFISF